ncbi:hypothetical protein [Streptomyces sp. NPDC020298]|uniref:hypothetical protein n=1 Tax=unclassified Streptomyces TaxID=2593676 RepID=UPI003404D418
MSALDVRAVVHTALSSVQGGHHHLAPVTLQTLTDRVTEAVTAGLIGHDADLLHGAAEAAAAIHAHCQREGCAGCGVRRDIVDVLRAVADVLGEQPGRETAGVAR